MATPATAPAAEGPAAERWALVGKTPEQGGVDVYVARSTVRRSGPLAQVAELWDFKSPRAFQGKPFLSVRNQFEYDCVLGRRRMLSTTGFAGHMGEGGIVASDKAGSAWVELTTTGLARDAWKAACARP